MRENTDTYKKYQKSLNTGTSQYISDRISIYEKNCKKNTCNSSLAGKESSIWGKSLQREIKGNVKGWSVRKMSASWIANNSLKDSKKHKDAKLKIKDPHYEIRFDEIKNEMEKSLTPDKILNAKYRDQNGYWLIAEIKYRNLKKKHVQKNEF